MADVKVDIAQDQERGTDRVMVSGGAANEGVVLKDTMEGGLIEACRRAEGIDADYYGVHFGGGILPLLREYLGLPAKEDDD